MLEHGYLNTCVSFRLSQRVGEPLISASRAAAPTPDGADKALTIRFQPGVASAHLATRFALPHQHRECADRDELVLRFMPLARRIARVYYTSRDREDVEQVAYLALVKAVDRFDPTQGNSFASYATPTITGEIMHYLRDHTWDVHVPRRLQERALQTARVHTELTSELGRAPRVQDIAARLGSDPGSVAEALNAAKARDAKSLDEGHDRGDSDRPAIADIETRGTEDQGFTRAIERAALRDALGRLSHQERRVLGLRFLYDLSQSEIAQRVGVSQMQVSRLLRGALTRIRQPEDITATKEPEPPDALGKDAEQGGRLPSRSQFWRSNAAA